MVKILHIAQTDTPHTCDVFKQIKEHTDFKHAIISCTPNKFMNDSVYDDIPIYVHNYLDYTDTPAMRSMVDYALSVENPDLIIGHSFSQVATILNYTLSNTDLPAMAFIWAYCDCIKSFHTAQFKKIFFDNLKVLSKLNFLVTTNKVLTAGAIRDYKIAATDFVEACPPVHLSQYTDHIPKTTKPILLLAKARCEKYIYASLPIAFKQFPNLEVHAFRTPIGIALAQKLGIYKKIIYHDVMTQESFAELLKSVNIVHTITPDPGTGGTAMQASYAGCINLMRNCNTSVGMINDKYNAFMCKLTIEDVTKKLLHSIQNVDFLCKYFKENNKHLIKYDRDNTWNNLYKALLTCLAGKKNKIAPGVTVPDEI